MKFLSSAVFCFFLGTLLAQKPCEKLSIYFDVNQSDISDQSIKSLSGLIDKLEGTDYLIELYGYADSTASAKYNLALSQKRIESVKLFLNEFESINFNYFETNLGEEVNSENKDLALSRRVDIYVLPVSDGKIVIKDGSAEVKVPMDYFSPCGACQSQPKIDAYYTVEEARAANIEFETNEGIPLISAGTFGFNFTSCNERERQIDDDLKCFTIFAEKVDLGMFLWAPDTINGVIYWKPMDIELKFDTRNNTYSFCTELRTCNLDRPCFSREYNRNYIFPEQLIDLRSEFNYLNKSRNKKSIEDTVGMKNRYFHFLQSFGKIKDTYFYLKKLPSDLPLTDTVEMKVGEQTAILGYSHIVELDYYEQLIFSESDTTLMVKLRNKPVQVGYYLKDVQEFIPFEWDKKNKRFYGQKPTGEFELAYLKKRDRLYVLPNEKLELKYRRFRKFYKPKFRFNYYKRFKRDKAYTQKKEEWDEFLERK